MTARKKKMTPEQKREFMRRIGSIGGKKSGYRPFRDQPGAAAMYGQIGGKKSKRGPAVKEEEEQPL
jgi:general stress protein YciG